MKKIALVIIAIFLLAACSTTQVSKSDKTGETFFDAEIVETLIPGKTTQEEVRERLGEPYPDPLKTPERWTYMYTYQKQIIFTFEDGVLKSKQWSEEFGIGAGK